jgi:NAD(P)H-hydrate epimerase
MNPKLTPPILSCAAAGEFEKNFFADESAEWAAMLEAGRAVAHGILQDFAELGAFPSDARLLTLVGKGHNGGDALIAIQEILRLHSGARADIVFAFGTRPLRPLVARAWQDLQQAYRDRVNVSAGDGWSATSGRAESTPNAAAAYTLSIDGVFGFQFRPPLTGPAKSLLRHANAASVRLRAAVDLPSGLSEPDAFHADFTYATGAVKAPIVDCENAGRIRYLDLGFFAPERDVSVHERVLTSAILDPLRALRPAHGDKRGYGHICILGGSRQYPGAVLMNVLAALHSGVGLVTAFVPETLVPAYAARAPEAMWVAWPETPNGSLALEGLHLWKEQAARATALAIGSGMGREPETLALAEELVKIAGVPVLLDADALQPNIIAAAKGPLLLTPHAGEFERISGGKELADYCAAAGATVILKGPVTRVCSGVSTDEKRKRGKAAAPQLKIYHSFFGGPVLSRGGSGDILAGLTAGQLALMHGTLAKTEPLTPPTLIAALRGATWHGLAADSLARSTGQTSATVTQLIDHLPRVLRSS